MFQKFKEKALKPIVSEFVNEMEKISEKRDSSTEFKLTKLLELKLESIRAFSNIKYQAWYNRFSSLGLFIPGGMVTGIGLIALSNAAFIPAVSLIAVGLSIPMIPFTIAHLKLRITNKTLQTLTTEVNKRIVTLADMSPQYNPELQPAIESARKSFNASASLRHTEKYAQLIANAEPRQSLEAG